MKVKKYYLFLSVLFMLFLICSFSVNANSDINILLNGKAVLFDDNTGYPYVDENNRTMVPLRVTMESAGFVVGYDNKAQTAIIITDRNRIEIPINTNKVYVNNNLKENDTLAVIKNNRTYLPIRMILESAHYTVEWDENTRTVNAYTYEYDKENYVPYHTTSLSTLVDALLSGDVVYINGQYYSTPESVKRDNNVQVYYWNDDLNIAIYPQPSRYALADMDNSSLFNNNTNNSDDTDDTDDWISEKSLYLYDSELSFTTYPHNGKMVPALIKSSTLSGMVHEQYFLTELPIDFAENNVKSGIFNNINIKVVDGVYFFLKSDLQKIGIID